MSKDKLIKISCELIKESLGQGIAGQYKIFYQSKTEDDILSSIGELMEEIFGPVNAKKKIIKIKKSLAVKEAKM